MALLLDLFGFLSVLLGGLATVARSLAVGGVIFVLCLARPLSAALGRDGEALLARCHRLAAWSALALALVVATSLAVQEAVLIDTTQISLSTALSAGFAVADLTQIAAALALALAWRLPAARSGPALLLLGLLIVASATATSHATARLDGRAPLALATALHQLGAAAWIGGIPYFLLGLARSDGAALPAVGRRFSQIALASVAVIAAAGVVMAAGYIDSLEGLTGTAYGVMVCTKLALFAGLLLLGAMNFRAVERLRHDPATPIGRLRRFAEVEIGVGITLFFAAASLTSLPPAADLTTDRVSAAEIAARLTPRWPSLSSPEHGSLAIIALQARLDAEAAAGQSRPPQAFVPGAGAAPPRNAADIAWSEYNHHWAGLLVLAIGALCLAERTGIAPWARNWPLVFLALAAFLLFRSDPEVWPLGQVGFFDSLRDPEVVQHRVFALLVIGFGLFEWGVRTGRIAARAAAYVFPLATAVASALLLTHAHALANVKEELLIELTHVPLALLGITAGWARWLELRLPPGQRAAAGWTWPICFVLIGLLLISYRES